MSQSCSILKCGRASRGFCDCCQQNLCLKHLNEHNSYLTDQLVLYGNEIDELSHKLNSVDIREKADRTCRKLQQWREDCHKEIDRIFARKVQEVEDILAKELLKERDKLQKLGENFIALKNRNETTKRDIDLLVSKLNKCKRAINELDKMTLHLNIHPFPSDNTLISIELLKEQQLDISASKPVMFKAIEISEGSKLSLAASGAFLLTHQNPNLCLLHANGDVIRQTKWLNGTIFDMCWISTLDRFVILERENVFLLDYNTMTMEKVQNLPQRKWMSCTCSETRLFLSVNDFGSSILEMSFYPSIDLIKEWSSPNTCGTDEFVTCILYKNENVACMIVNHTSKSVRIELKSAERCETLWSLPLHIVCAQVKSFRFCALPCDEWLVADTETGNLIQVNRAGKIAATIPYQRIPFRPFIFNRKILVMLTKSNILFYNLKV